jgi:hypothetical protein
MVMMVVARACLRRRRSEYIFSKESECESGPKCGMEFDEIRRTFEETSKLETKIWRRWGFEEGKKGISS